jgi:hypothetical protein
LADIEFEDDVRKLESTDKGIRADLINGTIGNFTGIHCATGPITGISGRRRSYKITSAWPSECNSDLNIDLHKREDRVHAGQKWLTIIETEISDAHITVGTAYDITAELENRDFD